MRCCSPMDDQLLWLVTRQNSRTLGQNIVIVPLDD
jgi:hypothetical protein